MNIWFECFSVCKIKIKITRIRKIDCAQRHLCKVCETKRKKSQLYLEHLNRKKKNYRKNKYINIETLKFLKAKEQKQSTFARQCQFIRRIERNTIISL